MTIHELSKFPKLQLNNILKNCLLRIKNELLDSYCEKIPFNYVDVIRAVLMFQKAYDNHFTLLLNFLNFLIWLQTVINHIFVDMLDNGLRESQL